VTAGAGRLDPIYPASSDRGRRPAGPRLLPACCRN